DHFSRYVAAYPLESKTTEEVTRALTKYVTTYGPVKELISDRGTEFTSALFRDVCKKLRIKWHNTTAYHPQSNGATERQNQNIKRVLSHLAANNRSTWNDALPYACLALNTSFQSVIEEIPYFLFYGRDAELPIVDCLKPPRIDYSLRDNYSAEVGIRLHNAFKTVKLRSRAAHDRAVQMKERGIRNDKVEVGDLVLLHNPTGKTCAEGMWPTIWNGPYRIIERTKTNATIRELYSGKKENVRMNRLKLAHLRGYAFP
ncbi:Integrase catalytic core, partial [Trinorchestia longiramus]